jgi:osmoprotectant transport system substrate-binding protein
MTSSTRRRTFLVGAMAAAGLALTACGDGGDALAPAATSSTSAAADTIVVGSANFPESVLLAQMYASALKAKGVNVSTKLNIGSRETYIPALQDGSIDLLPEYNGALLSYFSKSPKATDSEGVYAELKAALPKDLMLLEQSTAEDKDTLTVTKETAAKYQLKSIADLAGKSQNLTIGAAPEFKTRRAGLVGLKEVYGLTFKEFKPLDNGGPLTVNSVKDGKVDIGNIYSTDSSIEVNDFVSLEDPKSLFLAQNIVPVITATKATPTVTAALNALSAKLTTEVLTAELKKVQVDKADPATVAQDWVKANGLG